MQITYDGVGIASIFEQSDRAMDVIHGRWNGWGGGCR